MKKIVHVCKFGAQYTSLLPQFVSTLEICLHRFLKFFNDPPWQQLRRLKISDNLLTESRYQMIISVDQKITFGNCRIIIYCKCQLCSPRFLFNHTTPNQYHLCACNMHETTIHVKTQQQLFSWFLSKIKHRIFGVT